MPNEAANEQDTTPMSPLSRLSLIAATALVAFAAPAFAQERREIPAFRTIGEPTSAAEAEAVTAVLEAFRTAWSEQDVEALMALHSDDVEWINAFARIFQSADDLERFLVDRMFPNFDPAISRDEAANMELVSVRYVGDDVVILHVYADGRRGPSRNADENLRRTHLHFVLERQPDGWRIVHEVIMDAR